MTWPARVTRNGQQLSGRVSALLTAAATAAAVPLTKVVVVQGSWSAGSKSAGTHGGGGAFDLRTWNLTQVQRESMMYELRRRGTAAWLRGYSDGTSFDPHLHGIVMDEPGLSSEARTQVADYKKGLDGLARKGKDPYPRPRVVIGFPLTQPTSQPPPEDDVQLTDKIALVTNQGVAYSSPQTTVAGALSSTNYYVLVVRNMLAAQAAQIAALSKAVAALAADPDLDEARLTEIVKAAVAEAVPEVVADDVVDEIVQRLADGDDEPAPAPGQ
jgi:hypothetical protein